MQLGKGSKTDLTGDRYTVAITASGPGNAVDIAAVLLGADGRVRGDDDFVFFNNPESGGVALVSDAVISVDLAAVPADVHRVLVTASTESQGTTFAAVAGLSVDIATPGQQSTFVPSGLSTETVLQVVAFYRRGVGWRLDAVGGQGYSEGLAKFATEHGITVDDPGPDGSPPDVQSPAPVAHAPGPIDFEKVRVSLTKDSADKTARIDLRKSQGDPNWVLTVGLEWDGRGARYDRRDNVKRYGGRRSRRLLLLPERGDEQVRRHQRREQTSRQPRRVAVHAPLR